MSNLNAAKITLSDKPEEDFNFYLQFVTPLVSKLIEEKERELATEWINKLTEDKRNPDLRAEYLLLLLFALQRRQLSGPFLTSPSDEALQPFEDNLDMFQMMERMVKQRTKPAEVPPYYSEVSGDFKEYVVTQEIPDFGIHCYLATSNEPIQKWKNAHLAQIPRETTTSEAYQNGSRSCFGTVPVQHGSSQFLPPAPPTLYEDMIARDREERRNEYSVNLQALQSLIPRDSYMPEEIMSQSPQASFTNYEAERLYLGIHHRNVVPNDTHGVPIDADNLPAVKSEENFGQFKKTPSFEEFARQFRRSQEKLSSGEIEQMMADLEKRLRPKPSVEINVLPESIKVPQPTSRFPLAPQAPRKTAVNPIPSKHVATKKTRSSVSGTTNPIQKSRF